MIRAALNPAVKLAALLACVAPIELRAQAGGEAAYSFLDLAPAPRAAALGGKVNAVPSDDPSLAFFNPALLDSSANGRLSLNYVSFFAGVNYGYAAYSRSHPRAGAFAAGVHYVNYGRFTAADESGLITGDFTAAEYAFAFSWARALPWADSSLTVGVSVKPLLSVFERYSSYGLLADAGLTYRGRGGLFTAALVVRNAGGQLTPYADGGREPVPFEVQLGVSQRLQHAPFRFSLLAQRLERPRLGGGAAASGAAQGRQQESGDDATKGFGLLLDETMRHLIIGAECFPFGWLELRAGYNYNRRQDLKSGSRGGAAGFSWGLGIRASRFRIDYARSSWHLAGASNHFSVGVKL